MNRLNREQELFRYDYVLIAVVLLLSLLGLVTLYSAAFLFAENRPGRFGGGWTPLKSNLIVCGIMFPVFLFLTLFRRDKNGKVIGTLFRFDRLKNGKVIGFLLLITILANVLPFFPVFRKIDYEAGDAMRWISLKAGGRELVSFQPSEMIKVVLPLYLAFILDKNNEKLASFNFGPLPPIVFTGVFCGLALLQNNFSEAVLIALISLIICFAGGIRPGWFLLAIGAGSGLFYLLVFGDKSGHRYERMQTFLNPGADPFDTEYQINFSTDAIASGGFWGKGIGQGTVKMRMPEVHGDFVFASYVEESGFIGVLFYILLVAVFAGICYMVAWRSKDRFTRLAAFSLVTPIMLQTLLNIAVAAKLIPTTGVPLPFVSSGGSSLLLTLAASALLINLARRQVVPEISGGEYAG